MGDNKGAKNRLIELYGPECFIEKLHLRPPEDMPRHYTSKKQMKIMKQLTYHHIKEKSKGGKSTVENGALLSEENHIWFNHQTKEKQAELNQKFQEYKKCSLELTNDIKPKFEIKMAEITPTDTDIIVEPLNVYENMTPEEIKKYVDYKKERKEKIYKKFERELDE